jgi:hypothetical protein
MVAVDPDHPNIWEQEPYLDDLKRMAAQYGFVQVVLAAAEGPMIGLVLPFRVIKLPIGRVLLTVRGLQRVMSGVPTP